MDSAQSPATANAAPRPSPPKEATAIKQGDKVGNRFVIDERLGDGVFGTTYRAVDEKSGKKIAILMMDPALAADKASTDALRTSVKLATELVHKNVLGVFGMGKEGARRYVAYEYVDGQTLSELLDKKAEAGKQFTLKGAYNLMAHVCNGLQYAREKMSHDTLRPSVVLINRTGRVKVADFGFAALRPALLGAGTALGQWDRACLGDGSSPIDDLHALGIMLYALLVGAPPSANLRNDAADRLPGELSAVILRCLPEASERFDDPNDFKGTLLQAVDNLRSRERSNVGDRPGAGPASEESDDVGDEDAVDVEVQPVAGRPPSKAPGGFVIPELQVGGGADDDGTVQRWLMDKDGVDYGPFTSKQIVEKLFKEEISAETVIFDIETDRRQSLSEFGVFEDALLAWIHEKDKREKHRAEEAEAAAGRRRLMVLLGVIVAVVVVVGGSLGGWFLYQSSLPTPVKAHLASLVTPMRGGLPVVNLPEELPETVAEIRARRQKEAAERMARASAAERARLMEEERLAAQTEMVDVGAANTGGGGPFDRGAFDRVVASRQAQMVKCLQDEVRRDPGLKSLEVQITVIPRGDLVAVKMPAGSPRGQACVRSALRGLKVPPFQGTNYKIKLPYQFQ